MGSSRSLSNFASFMRITPCTRSTSLTLRPIASDNRIPVAYIMRKINDVTSLRTSLGVRVLSQTVNNRANSSLVNICGTKLVDIYLNLGYTKASIPRDRRYCENRITTPFRCCWFVGASSGDIFSQRSADSLVTVVAPDSHCSTKETKRYNIIASFFAFPPPALLKAI
jgi:hypothetical protein